MARSTTYGGGGGGGRGVVFTAISVGLLAAVMLQRYPATASDSDNTHHYGTDSFLRQQPEIVVDDLGDYIGRGLKEEPPASSRRRGAEEAVYGEEQLQAEENGVDRSCPYLIETEEEAMGREADTTLKGNIVKVEHWRFCRTGNHFSSMFRNLALGYCCKSKLLWLPVKDDVLAPGVFNEGTPGPRWFDFSTAPDVEGFDSDTCSKDITWAGPRAFRLEGVDLPGHDFFTPGLKECVRKVPRLLGCEAAYFFPTDVDVCPPREEQQEEGEAPDSGDLVIHVRSGDIFDEAVLPYYGQPPLQFYLRVMTDQRWNRIDLVTWAETQDSLNPVIPVLQSMQAGGDLHKNLHIHTNRSIGEDLRSMMCADALATARSTLICLTTFHTTATTIYEPSECNSKLEALSIVRPETKVFAMDWPRWEYSVYMKWENTQEQRKEMVQYNNVTGLPACPGATDDY